MCVCVCVLVCLVEREISTDAYLKAHLCVQSLKVVLFLTHWLFIGLRIMAIGWRPADAPLPTFPRRLYTSCIGGALTLLARVSSLLALAGLSVDHLWKRLAQAVVLCAGLALVSVSRIQNRAAEPCWM